MNYFQYHFSQIFIGAFILGTVVSQNPTAVLSLDKAEVTTLPGNPYFYDWSLQLESGGTAITVATPVKMELPDDLMLKFSLELSGMDIPDYEMKACEGFHDETVAKDMLSYGIPANFPKSCKIPAGKEFVIKSWKFPSHKIPPGVPDGKLKGVITVYMPGEEPVVTIKTEGAVSHKIPGLGR